MSINICFVSGHKFGFNSLKGILDSEDFRNGKLNISLLLSIDRTKKQSTVGFYDFKNIAKKHSIQHVITRSVKSEGIFEIIKSSKPDYLLVIGWSELVPSKILDIPKTMNNGIKRHDTTHGCIGMHPTLLPQGRGRAPIPWTIIKGLKESGVTTFLLEEDADAGGIVFQERFSVEPDETATTLFSKCLKEHYLMAKKLSSIMAKRELTWVEQDLSKICVWPRRRPEDGLINFADSINLIYRLVRGLTDPYPGAYFLYKHTKIIANRIKLHLKNNTNLPGTIVNVSSKGLPHIAAKDGIIECLEIDSEKKIPVFTIGTKVNYNIMDR